MPFHNRFSAGFQAVYGGGCWRDTGGSTGPYPYTGGLRYDVKRLGAFGQRVSNIEVRDARSGNCGRADARTTSSCY